ncbi:MAG: GNAT family N-acetyltransferase [candidate division Zixibacteria bacterium]|nr:GNAT family N-acetyltransferase [candidate division Zixibacteria bacterium]
MKTTGSVDRVHFLESERLFLTPTTDDDFEDHYRWLHDRGISYLDDRHFRPVSRARAKEQFDARRNAEDVMSLAVLSRQDGRFMGLTELYGIDYYERKCYWGLILGEGYRRQGYGTEIAELIMKYVFDDLGFNRLKSYTHSGNTGSMQFHKSLGFVQEGRLRQEFFFGGEYVDGLDYAILRGEYFSRVGRTERNDDHE